MLPRPFAAPAAIYEASIAHRYTGRRATVRVFHLGGDSRHTFWVGVLNSRTGRPGHVAQMTGCGNEKDAACRYLFRYTSPSRWAVDFDSFRKTL